MSNEEIEFHESDWVTAAEAAKLLRRSRSAITRYASSGLLEGLRKYDRLFIRRKSLEAFKHPRRGNRKLL